VVHSGTVIHVLLSNTASVYQWSAITSSQPDVVSVIDTTPGDQDVVSADFRARSPGSATLQASDSPHCEPACGAPTFAWHVLVTVQA